MSASRPTRPSASMIVAVVALVLALGGTSYAAAKMSGKQIYKRSIPADRVMQNALTGTQINESRLGQVPRAALALEAETAKVATLAETAKTADAATTAKTADTATKALDADKLQGREAAAFMANATVVRTATGPNVPGPAAGTPSNAQANCTAQEKAIAGGGGWYISGQLNPTELHAPVTASVPVLDPAGQITGWRVHGRNLSGTERHMRAWVVCVPLVA